MLYIIVIVSLVLVILQDRISKVNQTSPVDSDYDIPAMLDYIDYLESVIEDNRLNVSL